MPLGQSQDIPQTGCSGIPVPLWSVLIALTIILALFVSFSAIQYSTTAVIMAACFTVGVVSILVIAKLLDYPFEGALALRPTDFIDVIGKISAQLDPAPSQMSECFVSGGALFSPIWTHATYQSHLG